MKSKYYFVRQRKKESDTAYSKRWRKFALAKLMKSREHKRVIKYEREAKRQKPMSKSRRIAYSKWNRALKDELKLYRRILRRIE